MDANFGLVHKHHSGTSATPPVVPNGYFIDAETVDQFLASYKTDNLSDKVI